MVVKGKVFDCCGVFVVDVEYGDFIVYGVFFDECFE